mgnify:CR=1 FL=1
MSQTGVLDVREFINARKMSGYQWWLVLLCFLIVATDGIDVAIMGFLAPAITRDWGISRAAFGLVMSAAPVGLAAGGAPDSVVAVGFRGPEPSTVTDVDSGAPAGAHKEETLPVASEHRQPRDLGQGKRAPSQSAVIASASRRCPSR